ncbi:MAG: apolipoprotein N-acyltransferase, partial [candidate division Zixibacteria bacterium]|nr:apolipoprotein N-acyltransferase [candidate division Zixibacteria bacterium]
PYGRIKSSTKIYVQDILKDEISKRKELTFYTRYGDYFARGVLFVSFLILAYSIFRRFTGGR